MKNNCGWRRLRRLKRANKIFEEAPLRRTVCITASSADIVCFVQNVYGLVRIHFVFVRVLVVSVQLISVWGRALAALKQPMIVYVAYIAACYTHARIYTCYLYAWYIQGRRRKCDAYAFLSKFEHQNALNKSIKLEKIFEHYKHKIIKRKYSFYTELIKIFSIDNIIHTYNLNYYYFIHCTRSLRTYSINVSSLQFPFVLSFRSYSKIHRIDFLSIERMRRTNVCTNNILEVSDCNNFMEYIFMTNSYYKKSYKNKCNAVSDKMLRFISQNITTFVFIFLYNQ